jgi:hypothetical protein
MVHEEMPVYEVTGQSSTTKYDEGAPPVEGIEVRFSIPSIQVNGSVFVPGKMPDPESARDAIRQWVASAFEIAALKD